MLNKQQLFDKVVRHLLTQKKKAYEDGRCQYLTSDGLKCAIGCVMETHKDFRGSLYALRRGYPSALPFPEELDEFGGELQAIHDGSFFQGVSSGFAPSEWFDVLLNLGLCEGLDVSVFDEFDPEGIR